MVDNLIRVTGKPVDLFGYSLLDGFIELLERLFCIGEEGYFIHRSFLRDPQSLPLPSISSFLALRILFINSGFCERSQSSKSSFVLAVSKTVKGKVTVFSAFIEGIIPSLFFVSNIRVMVFKREGVVNKRLYYKRLYYTKDYITLRIVFWRSPGDCCYGLWY